MDTNPSLEEVKPKEGSFLKGPYSARAPYWVALAFTVIPAVSYWVMVEASDSQVDRMTALLTPMLAIVAGWVGYQQWRTARQKLDLDLFNRRFTLYDATVLAMSKVARTGYITEPELEDYIAATRGARILFDAELDVYLEEVRLRLESIALFKGALATQGLEPEQLASYGNALRDARMWVRNEWASKRVDAAFKKLKPLD